MEIRFASKEHEKFFYSMLVKSGNMDVYHQAFFYTMGIAKETRLNTDQLFDFNHDRIKPEGLAKGWQTGSTIRLTRLAFNLWNGFVEENQEKLFTMYAIFDCSYAPYFWEAVKLRYPEYCS